MIFEREKTLFFKKDHLLAAHAFYEKHGGKTIILARFMPILRTFAPVVAGVGRMSYLKFLAFNVVGGIGWVVSMILIGYFLPSVLNPPLQLWLGPEFLVEKHVEKIVILVVLVSIAPGFFMWLRSRIREAATSPRGSCAPSRGRGFGHVFGVAMNDRRSLTIPGKITKHSSPAQSRWPWHTHRPQARHP